MLKIWNMLLIVLTFLLTIFGTFVTRSGIIASVHSFGNSNLGPLFLIFMLWVLVGSLYLIISRRKALRSRNRLDSFLSRESSFLFNNLILVAAAFAILWGTLFPIISEAVRGVKITVGPPFFNTVNLPIGMALLLLTGVCPLIAWRKASVNNLLRNFLFPGGMWLSCFLLLLLFGIRDIFALISFSLSVFVLSSIWLEFYRGTRSRIRFRQERPLTALFNLIASYRRRYGGYIVHIGMILIFIGVTGSSVFKREKEQLMHKGDQMQIAPYQLIFTGLDQYRTETSDVASASLQLKRNNEPIGLVYPSKHYHRLQQQTMTEVSISSNLKEDLYLILGGINEDSSVYIKAQINPLVAWIWIGGYVLIAGTVIAIWPTRKKRSLREKRAPGEKVQMFAEFQSPVS